MSAGNTKTMEFGTTNWVRFKDMLYFREATY